MIVGADHSPGPTGIRPTGPIGQDCHSGQQCGYGEQSRINIHGRHKVVVRREMIKRGIA